MLQGSIPHFSLHTHSSLLTPHSLLPHSTFPTLCFVPLTPRLSFHAVHPSPAPCWLCCGCTVPACCSSPLAPASFLVPLITFRPCSSALLCDVVSPRLHVPAHQMRTPRKNAHGRGEDEDEDASQAGSHAGSHPGSHASSPQTSCQAGWAGRARGSNFTAAAPGADHDRRAVSRNRYRVPCLLLRRPCASARQAGQEGVRAKGPPLLPLGLTRTGRQ